MSDDDDIFGGPPIDMSWADLGRINQDGYVDTDPIGDDPRIFEDQFERRSREKERTPSRLTPVTVVPNRNGPWSANNQLGIQQRFAPDANNLQTILKLDEWDFPAIWTICLGLTFDENNWPPVPGTFNAFNVTALINFGIGGVTQQVEVDWINGSAITLPFNALNIIARYDAPIPTASPYSAPPDLGLRVSVSKWASRNARPTRTFIVTEDDINAGLLFPVPPFAKQVVVTSDSPALLHTDPTGFFHFETSRINGFSAGNFALSQLVSFADPLQQTVGAPLPIFVPPAARAWAITDIGGITAQQSTPIRVQFLIGL